MPRNVFDKSEDPNKGREISVEEAEKLAGNVEARLAKLPGGYHYELVKDANGNDTVIIAADKPKRNPLEPSVIDTEATGFPVWGNSSRASRPSDRYRSN